LRFSTTSNPHDSSARCSSIVWKISTGRNILTTCDAIPFLFRLRILSHIYDMYERIRCEVHPLSVPASPSPTPVVAWAYEYCVPLPDAFRIVLNGDWPSLMLSENRCEQLRCLPSIRNKRFRFLPERARGQIGRALKQLSVRAQFTGGLNEFMHANQHLFTSLLKQSVFLTMGNKRRAAL